VHLGAQRGVVGDPDDVRGGQVGGLEVELARLDLQGRLAGLDADA
jgi:hypothetical protein